MFITNNSIQLTELVQPRNYSNMKFKITTALLLILNIVLIIHTFLTKKSEGKIQLVNNYYDENRMIEKIDEGKYISPNTSFKNLNEERILLKDLVKNKPKILFRYSNRNCWSCVEKLLKRINSYKIDSLLKKNIVIIASYDEYRPFTVMHKNIDWGFEPYFFSEKFDYLNADKLNQPYLMVLDSSFHSKMFFFPNIDDETSLRGYFDLVQNRFFK